MINHKKNQLGFTLLEIMVVIAIITIFLLITAPSIKSYANTLTLKSVTNDVVSDLRYAQQLTVTEQRVYSVVFDIGLNKYDIILEPATIVKTKFLNNGTSIGSITDLTDNKVVFNFMGAVSQSGSIILNQANGSSQTIDIKPSGYIDVR